MYTGRSEGGFWSWLRTMQGGKNGMRGQESNNSRINQSKLGNKRCIYAPMRLVRLSDLGRLICPDSRSQTGPVTRAYWRQLPLQERLFGLCLSKESSTFGSKKRCPSCSDLNLRQTTAMTPIHRVFFQGAAAGSKGIRALSALRTRRAAPEQSRQAKL